MKTCSKCKKEKSLCDFGIDKSTKDGLNRTCKECVREVKRKYRKTQKGKITEKKYEQSNRGKEVRKGIDLKYKYGITLSQHKQMYINQNGRCLICDDSINYMDIVTDHCHITDKIRGLLCRSCNSKLGWFENKKDIILKYIGDK